MKTVVEELLERHSQVRSAHEADGHVVIYWADGRKTHKTTLEAERWIKDHPPRCWSWTHSPARNTVRDYCGLTLDHDGPHRGDREVWT